MWEDNFQQLKTTYATDKTSKNRKKGERNTGEMPSKYFQHWTSQQRYNHRDGLLSMERVGKLKAIGFDFFLDEKGANKDTKEWAQSVWEQKYEELKVFERQHGHSLPPYTGSTDKLRYWVALQRKRRKGEAKPGLSKDEIERLDMVGFVWSGSKGVQMWETTLQRLLAFEVENGHMRVPIIYAQDEALAKWCCSQRRANNEGILPESRLKRLKEVGFPFSFDPLERHKAESNCRSVWRQQFVQLDKFREKHGHCQVPTCGSTSNRTLDGRLRKWVVLQRQKQENGDMEEHYKRLLDEVGFVWKADQNDEANSILQRSWDTLFDEVVA